MSTQYQDRDTQRSTQQQRESGLGVFFLGAIALVAVFFLCVWLYGILSIAGNSVAGWVGGGTPGGGGEPAGNWRTFLAFALFVLALVMFLAVLLWLPLKATWLDHTLAARQLRISPLAFYLMTAVANSPLANTWLGQKFFEERWVAGLVACVVGYGYVVLWSLRVPYEFKLFSGLKEFSGIEHLKMVRPASRYVLSLLYLVVIIQMGFVVFTLLPSTIEAMAPNWSWWDLVWPFNRSTP